MKTKLVALFAIAFMTACETHNTTVTHTDVEIAGRNIKTYEIEGCEYIGNVYGGNGDFLTHKGNCKNPIHNCK